MQEELSRHCSCPLQPSAHGVPLNSRIDGFMSCRWPKLSLFEIGSHGGLGSEAAAPTDLRGGLQGEPRPKPRTQPSSARSRRCVGHHERRQLGNLKAVCVEMRSGSISIFILELTHTIMYSRIRSLYQYIYIYTYLYIYIYIYVFISISSVSLSPSPFSFLHVHPYLHPRLPLRLRVSLSLSLSLCVNLFLSLSLPLSLSISISIFIRIYVSIFVCVYVYVDASVCVSVYL